MSDDGIDFQPLAQSGSDGIDFQPLDQSQSPSNAGIESVAEPIRNVENWIGQKVGKVTSTLAPAAKIAGQVSDVVMPGSGIPEMAQQLAPQIAQGEGQAVSDYGSQKGYPLTGAAVGTGIAMIPDAVNAYVGMKGLKNVDNPLVKGLLNTPQELGPEYAALDTKAGVSGELPVQRGTMAKFPGLDGTPQNQPPPQAPNVAPTIYPKDTKTYLNFVRNRLDSIRENMTPQELSDHHALLDEIMTNMKVKGQSGTKIFAKAAQAGSDVTDIQNANVPGRSSLNTAYGVAKGLEGATNAIKKYGSKAVGVTGSIGGLGALYDYFKK